MNNPLWINTDNGVFRIKNIVRIHYDNDTVYCDCIDGRTYFLINCKNEEEAEKQVDQFAKMVKDT